LLKAAELQEQVDFTAERHWVVDPTILVAWHASYVARENGATVRLAGFMTLEMRDGRIGRLREWVRRRDGTAA
jgi:ketosteroid isomerase-like protein